jgi:hypothetical protein
MPTNYSTGVGTRSCHLGVVEQHAEANRARKSSVTDKVLRLSLSSQHEYRMKKQSNREMTKESTTNTTITASASSNLG